MWEEVEDRKIDKARIEETRREEEEKGNKKTDNR